MKTTLTIEQSATLISKGVSIHYASGWQNDSSLEYGGGYVFTISDLLSLLPKEIENRHYSLDLMADNVGWDSMYSSANEKYDSYFVASEKELIDVLYKTLLWAINHNYVKFD